VKYWIDTEFIERPYTIDLISVGLVAQDGREFYAESSEVDWSKASRWTLQNVRPQLDGKGMRRMEIGYAVRRFTDGDEHPVFWGYFPAYDWIAFTWLFGSMDELPFHYPQLKTAPSTQLVGGTLTKWNSSTMRMAKPRTPSSTGRCPRRLGRGLALAGKITPLD
jgi:3' exoribonuclease, RNase T-like